jgi:tRNA-dependent cyclodipeptide synthase
MPLNQTLRKNSNVLWTISIIQDQNPEAQTKSEFAEMANDVINTPTIDTLTLCLADNLQRFRFMINDGLSKEEAIKHCQSLSAQWHEDNSESINKLQSAKKLSLITWQEFLEWPEYKQTVKDVESWYKENGKFRHDVDGRIRQELKRIKADATIIDPTIQADLLKKYMFEELAFQKFSSSKRFHYEIYKNSWPPAMNVIKNNTDFVPSGFMIPLHFTQFEPTPKKSKEHFHPSGSVFSVPSKIETINKPNTQKALEFIEKAFQLLPPEKQDRAVEALLKFTTQEIIPLCYSSNVNTLKT